MAFYGCKITPEDLQHVVVRSASLAGKVANFALHPFEDERADKRLELWFELGEGVELTTPVADLTLEVLAELARVNQDFRESERMIPDGRRPTLRLFPFGQSPISGAGHSYQEAIHRVTEPGAHPGSWRGAVGSPKGPKVATRATVRGGSRG